MHLRYFVGLILALCLFVRLRSGPGHLVRRIPPAAQPRKSRRRRRSRLLLRPPRRLTGKKAAARRRARARSKRLSQVAVHRINRDICSVGRFEADGEPVDRRPNPAAYTGVESWTHRHAETDAGALGYLVLGYARLQDRQFAEAISDLKKAQPRAGELADYIDYFLGEAYAGNGDYPSAIEHLRDFSTRNIRSRCIATKH